MAIKARIGDVVLEIETEADLRMFLSAARAGAVMLSAASRTETVLERLTRFYARLGTENQRNLIHSLARTPEGLTDAQIRTNLGIDTNTSLAGIMSGISKNANACGLSIEHVLVRHTLQGSEAWYRYRLTPEMRDVVVKESPKALIT